MKIFSISDLHLSSMVDKPMNVFGGNWENYWEDIKVSWQHKVSDEDIVLISGDISWGMKLEEALPDIMDISRLPGIKIMIRGNHDYWWQSISVVRSKLPPKMYCLQNDAVKIENYVFCGSRGWIIPENEKVDQHDLKMYLREEIRLELALKSAKAIAQDGDKIIVLVHYPPFNSQYVEGYTSLFEKYKVDACVYGHLHGDKCRTDKLVEKNGIKYYLTSCDQVDNTLVDINI